MPPVITNSDAEQRDEGDVLLAPSRAARGRRPRRARPPDRPRPAARAARPRAPLLRLRSHKCGATSGSTAIASSSSNERQHRPAGKRESVRHRRANLERCAGDGEEFAGLITTRHGVPAHSGRVEPTRVFRRVARGLMSEKLPLRMAIGLATGLGLGVLAHAAFGDAAWLSWLIRNFIEPAGQIFLRLLFMLVIPLIVSRAGARRRRARRPAPARAHRARRRSPTRRRSPRSRSRSASGW